MLSSLRDAANRIRRGPTLELPRSSTPYADDQLMALFDVAPDAMICVDPSGRIAMANHQVGVMFGYERADLLGAEVELLLPESVRSQHAQHRRDYIRHPHVRSMGSGASLVARRRDGSQFLVEVSLTPYLAGRAGSVVVAVRDVSGQRALEAASRESEERLRQVAESVDLIFLLLQLEPQAYLYVSSGAQRLMGLDVGSFEGPGRGRGLHLVHPDDRDAVMNGYLADSLAGMAAASEHRLVLGDGELVWVRTVATPVPNPHGPPERTVITIEDITVRVLAQQAIRDAEASARAANESKTLFLSRMSHELRTPLNAVLGFGQLLSRQLAGTEHAEAVDYVLKGGKHLLELINDVLDITRIESGEMSLSLESVELSGLVDESLQLMRPLAAAANVSLAHGSEQPEVWVFADRQRVRQILLNLLSNAIKYNRDGGSVWVGWAADGGQVRLSVRDTGKGIAPELQHRLFVPFDRLGAEGTAVEGAGIGLALTRSLAGLMAGTVGFESSAGEGATFTVTLPEAPLHRGTPTRASGTVVRPKPVDPTHASAAGRATLLYIEDNEANVRVVEHLLELRSDWRVIHAALGGLGVEIARAHQPDLIFLDLHLPDLPGREVLQALKRRPETQDLPVVVLSADATMGLPRELREAGAQGFLTKPLDIDVVLALLDGVHRDRVDVELRPGVTKWDRHD